MDLYTLEFFHKKMEAIQTDISTRFQFEDIDLSKVKEPLPFDVLKEKAIFPSCINK